MNRQDVGRRAAPVRMVHLGLGNFTRAHQAWYTEHAPDRDEWGIAAFTGRRPAVAELLGPQDGLYTLITKHADGDRYEVISSLSRVHPADDTEALVRYLADPRVAVVTSTVTEAGYHRAPDGSLDVDAGPVAADLAALRALARPNVDALSRLRLGTIPVRVLAGLLARYANGAGPITILPCDNLPGNGEAFGRVVTQAARLCFPGLEHWLDDNVSWATCMVDRITPATTSDDIARVARTQGYEDASPVPTEPFSEWVISGDFLSGMPDWASAGAQLVGDVGAYEQRKLWMLNGSHSLLAYVGPLYGVETVAEAMAHPQLRRLVTRWWDEAGPELTVGWEEYASALVTRYENPGMRHLLGQIAADGSQKLPVRILPVVRAWRRRAAMPVAGVTALAGWMLHLRGHGAPVRDSARELPLLSSGGVDDARRMLGFFAADLADDLELAAAVAEAADGLALGGGR